MALKQILNSLKKFFEPKRNNPVSLLDDNPLDSNFKSLKIGDKGSILELSNEEINIPGTLYVKDLKISNTGTIDSVAISTDPDADSTHGLNDLSDASYSSGDLKITSLDTLGPSDGSGEGDDVKYLGQNAQGLNEVGGALYLTAGAGTGNQIGGTTYIQSSLLSGATGSVPRAAATIASFVPDGTLVLKSADGTTDNSGVLKIRLRSGTQIGTISATHLGGTGPDGADMLIKAIADLELDAAGGEITFADSGTVFATFSQATSSFTLHEAGQDASLDYFKVACDSNGATTISTVHAFSNLANLTLAPDGGLILSSNGILAYASILCNDPLLIKEEASANVDLAGHGQVWVKDDAPNNLCFTDDTGEDVILTKLTAVWGGNIARATGLNGNWIGIPTGYQSGVALFGTGSGAPDTSYTITTTADDISSVIWQSIHGLRILNCRIYYGQGSSVNTRHTACLMRYDIDANGDLTNGVEVAGPDNDGGSDDYTTLAFMDLTMTSDVTVTNAQVLIAMVYCMDGINAAVGLKCIIEYQNIS